MTEKVAKAMWESIGHNGFPWEQLSLDGKEQWRSMGRAACEALLREMVRYCPEDGYDMGRLGHYQRLVKMFGCSIGIKLE